MESQQVLDRVQSMAQLAELEADPGAYVDRLAGELGSADTRDQIAARDARFRDALAQLDALSMRVMRIHLDHVLANEPSIATPTRKVFATTIVSYEHKLAVLEARARDVASRGGARDPEVCAGAVVEAARATLALRSALRTGVLALISHVTTSSVAAADQQARDRRLDEPTRRAWSAVRRELEVIAAQPDRVAVAELAARLATWPAQLDDPDPSSEPSFADLIEIE